MDNESYRGLQASESSISASEHSKEENWIAGDRIEFRDPSHRGTGTNRPSGHAWLPGIVQEVQPIGPSWARVPRHVYWIKAGRYTYKCRSGDMRRPACLA